MTKIIVLSTLLVVAWILYVIELFKTIALKKELRRVEKLLGAQMYVNGIKSTDLTDEGVRIEAYIEKEEEPILGI